jgi:hypothetical protein
MPNAIWWRRPSRTAGAALMAGAGVGSAANRILVASLAVAAAVSSARGQNESTATPALQVEVQDSVGLPLPDARVEVYTPIGRSKFWEWALVQPETLPLGIFLLRFSHPGYEPSVFSVPLEIYKPVSLRVRLSPQADTLVVRREGRAHVVRAIGLARVGRRHLDVVGFLRVLHRAEIERAGGTSLSTVFGRTKGTELIQTDPAVPGAGTNDRPVRGCVGQVTVNGNRLQKLTNAQFQAMYGVGEAEYIEVVGLTTKPAFDYSREPLGGCNSLRVWFKVP